MTRITNTEQVLLLLRAQLQRAAQTRKNRKADAVGRSTRRDALKRVQDIAGVEGMSEETVERALVAGLLADEFGADVANDAGFQSMVDDVMGMIRRDDASGALLKGAMAQLGKGQR